MIILGVTGSIGSGKSHFCKKLSQIRGVKIFSSDEMVHNLYSNKNFAQKLIDLFGVSIAFDKINSPLLSPLINRQKLGEIVFKNPEKKKQLEELVYPELARQRHEIIKLLNRQNFKGVLVFEIPLLFENNLENECDAIITIFCSPIIQKQRVLKRKNMNEDKFKNILNSQTPVHEKLRKTHFAVNSGDCQLSATIILNEILTKITSNFKL